MKKNLLIFLSFFVFIGNAFASLNQIIWTWEEYDKRVAWYRYQINDLDEDNISKWKYVPNIDRERYIIIDVDEETSQYVLYIQSSYDGVNWSPIVMSVVGTDVYPMNKIKKKDRQK